MSVRHKLDHECFIHRGFQTSTLNFASSVFIEVHHIMCTAATPVVKFKDCNSKPKAATENKLPNLPVLNGYL